MDCKIFDYIIHEISVPDRIQVNKACDSSVLTSLYESNSLIANIVYKQSYTGLYFSN